MSVSGKFTLRIEIGDDALQTPQDLAEILREVAMKVEAIDPTDTTAEHKVLDDNGNSVGQWEYEVEFEEEDDGE